MTRPRPTDRLEQLIDAATRVFIRTGYRRAQMAEIAREMGVSPGTLYLYVESKEALFALVLAQASGDAPLPGPEALPLRTPTHEALLAMVRERLQHAMTLPTLVAARLRPEPDDPRSEFRQLVGELYDTTHRFRLARNLLSASALDWPELNAIYYREARKELLGRLAEYLECRVRTGHLPPLPHPPTAARLILETVAWFTRHRFGDVDPGPVTDQTARETVLHVLTRGFCWPEPSDGGKG